MQNLDLEMKSFNSDKTLILHFSQLRKAMQHLNLKYNLEVETCY